jgi:hypothetical protein
LIFCFWGLCVRNVSSLKISPLQGHGPHTVPSFNQHRAIFKKLVILWRVSSSGIWQFCILEPTWRPVALELECSYSLGTDVRRINSRILNMNKIRSTVQALARRTSIHTSTYRDTHTDVWYCKKDRIQRDLKYVNSSNSRDRFFFFHGQNSLSYSNLGTDAAVGETPQDEYFRKHEPGSDTIVQLAWLRQPYGSHFSLSLKTATWVVAEPFVL